MKKEKAAFNEMVKTVSAQYKDRLKAKQDEIDDLDDRILRIHELVKRMASFTQGVSICELIDNPSGNKAYDSAVRVVHSMVQESAKLAGVVGGLPPIALIDDIEDEP